MLACALLMSACNDDTTNRQADGGGLADGGAKFDTLTNDAPAADAGTDVVTSMADTRADTGGGDSGACPSLTGVYSVSYGGVQCGDFNPLAMRQRIDGAGCNQRFEYNGNSLKGLEGQFTVAANGSFGPVTLKLGSQDASCTGSTPEPGVVRVSCNGNACLLNFTRTGPL